MPCGTLRMMRKSSSGRSRLSCRRTTRNWIIQAPSLRRSFTRPPSSSIACGAGVSASIVSQARASALVQHVRDETGLLTSGSAGLMAFRDIGFFEIDFETAKPLHAQVGILAELENIKKYGLTKEQLARAKALIAQNHYHEIETLSGMAQDIAYYEALGDWKKALSYFSAIQKVSADDIVRVAKKYLSFE